MYHHLLACRFLKTLLLEGNELVTLPVELSRLSHLTGLNLSNNPLQDPPKEVTDRGTKVLRIAGVCCKKEQELIHAWNFQFNIPPKVCCVLE